MKDEGHQSSPTRFSTFIVISLSFTFNLVTHSVPHLITFLSCYYRYSFHLNFVRNEYIFYLIRSYYFLFKSILIHQLIHHTSHSLYYSWFVSWGYLYLLREEWSIFIHFSFIFVMNQIWRYFIQFFLLKTISW